MSISRLTLPAGNCVLSQVEVVSTLQVTQFEWQLNWAVSSFNPNPALERKLSIYRVDAIMHRQVGG